MTVFPDILRLEEILEEETVIPLPHLGEVAEVTAIQDRPHHAVNAETAARSRHCQREDVVPAIRCPLHRSEAGGIVRNYVADTRTNCTYINRLRALREGYPANSI